MATPRVQLLLREYEEMAPVTATSRRRKPPMVRILSPAEVEARLDGHEDLCTERFRNLDAKIDDVKDDVRVLSGYVEKGMQTLNDDAKKAIDNLGSRQDGFHKMNSDTLQQLTLGLSQLTLQVASGKGSFEGASGAVRFILQIILPIGMSLATLIIVALKHP